MSHKWLLSGTILISQSELLWTKVSTGLQVIPPVSVLSITQTQKLCNDAVLLNLFLCALIGCFHLVSCAQQHFYSCVLSSRKNAKLKSHYSPILWA